MDLLGAGLAEHRDESAAGGPAYERVVHHHDASAFQHLANGVVLDTHAEVAIALVRLDEGAAHVVIADEGKLEWQPRLDRVSEGRRVRGVRNGEDAVGVCGMLLRQLAPEGAPRRVNRATPEARVGASEVHQLEDAVRGHGRRQARKRVDLGVAYLQDFARLYIADVVRP